MDVELKWHEMETTTDPNDPRFDNPSWYLVSQPSGLVLAAVRPCDVYLGCWSVQTFVPVSRWVGITISPGAGRRLAELARADKHPISRYGRDELPIEPGLPPAPPCVMCGKPAPIGRPKCLDCDPIKVDVTPPYMGEPHNV